MIIGIAGFKSSGKDTIAEYLINEYGFKRLSFASAVKDILSIMFSWPRDKLEGLTKEDREWREMVDPWWSKKLQMPELTPRFVMQYIATDLFRNHFNQDIWINIVEKQLEENKYTNIVITDCRFQNEINMIKNIGGKIIQVHRNVPEWFYKYRSGEDRHEIYLIHRSETEWIRCHRDYDIDNDNTMEELHKKIKDIVEKTT